MALTAEVLAREFVQPAPRLADGRTAVVTSGFRTDSRPEHDGVDLLFPYRKGDLGTARVHIATDSRGQPVWYHPAGLSALAPADGAVLLSNVTPTGGHVYLQHAHDVQTQQMHLARRFVSAGQRVKKGQVIGEIGYNTIHGTPGLIHDHFQMRIGGELVDPKPYLLLMPAIADPRSLEAYLPYAVGGVVAWQLYRMWKRSRRA